MAQWNATQIGSLVLLFLLLGGMSATVEIGQFKEKFTKKTGILVGCGCQFFILPFIGFCSTKIFDLPPVAALALMVMTSSPGGAFSNMFCSLFNVDLALSVAMTTVSTVCCVAMLPFNLWLYVDVLGNNGELKVELDWASLLASVGTAIAATAFGLFVGSKLPSQRGRFNMLGNVSGIGLMVLGALSATAKPAPEDGSLIPKGMEEWCRPVICSGDCEGPLLARPWNFYAATAFPCVVGLFVAITAASLPCVDLRRPERVAICIETLYQNTGLALSIALTAFSDPCEQSAASGVPVMYGLVEAVVLPGLLFIAWRIGWTYAPASDSFCTIIRNVYDENGMLAAPEGEGEGEGGRSAKALRKVGAAPAADEFANPAAAGMKSMFDGPPIDERWVQELKGLQLAHHYELLRGAGICCLDDLNYARFQDLVDAGLGAVEARKLMVHLGGEEAANAVMQDAQGALSPGSLRVRRQSTQARLHGRASGGAEAAHGTGLTAPGGGGIGGYATPKHAEDGQLAQLARLDIQPEYAQYSSSAPPAGAAPAPAPATAAPGSAPSLVERSGVFGETPEAEKFLAALQRENIKPEYLREHLEVFNHTGTGSLPCDDLLHAIQDFGLGVSPPTGAPEDFSVQELQRLCFYVSDADGTVCIDDFIDLLLVLQKSSRRQGVAAPHSTTW